MFHSATMRYTSLMKKMPAQILAVFILIVLGKIGAFFRDVLLSSNFGAGEQTDAFFIANAVPGLIFSGVFATIALVVLPIYIRDTNDENGSRDRFLHTAFVLYLSLAVGLSIFCIVFAKSLTAYIAPQAPESTLALAVKVTRVLALGFIFTSWVGLHNAIQQANKSFIWPNVVPVFNHLVVAIGIGFSALTGGSIVTVAIAAAGGWALQAPLHWLLARKFYTIKPAQLLKPDSVFTRRLLLLSFPVFLSISLDQLNSILDLYLGSGFGAGALTHLSFAFRLTILIGGIFSIPVSFFVFPYLSDSLSSQNSEQTRSLLMRGVSLVLVMTMPILVYTYLEAEALISLVFERGAFSKNDVISTAAILKMYVIGTVFIGLREVLNRVLIADQNTRLLVLFSGASVIIHFTASSLLLPNMGLPGIALGATIGTAAFVVLQLGYLVRYRRNFVSYHLLSVMAVLAISCALTIFVKEAFLSTYQLLGALRLLVDVAVLGAVYFGCVALCSLVIYQIWRVKLWKL